MRSRRQGASRLVQARLNANYEDEEKALQIYDKLHEQGFSAREILRDALLNMEGITPQPSGNTDDSRLIAMVAGINEKVGEVLLALKNADLDGLRAFANADDDEESAEHAAAIVENLTRRAHPSTRRGEE